MLQNYSRTGADRDRLNLRNLSATRFNEPSADLNRPFVLDYDATDNPVIASSRFEGTRSDRVVYLARFAR